MNLLPPAAGADHSELDGHVRTAPAARLRHVVDAATGELTLATGGRPAAALVSDGAGGYVLTRGAVTDAAMIARIDGDVFID